MPPEPYSMEKKKQEFEAFYRETYLEVIQYVRLHIRDRNDLEDVVSRIYLVAWQKQESFSDYENKRGWLILTAKNVIGNYLQAKRKREAWIELVEDPVLVGSENTRELLSCDLEEYRPGNVSEEDFRMFLMFAVEKQQVTVVAKHFGLSVAACYKRVERTRKRLREHCKKIL